LRRRAGGRSADFCPRIASRQPRHSAHSRLRSNRRQVRRVVLAASRIKLDWSRRNDRVEFAWIESGGPQPDAARGEGFGTTLLRRGLQQFDGLVETRFEPDGVRCKLSLSLPSPRHHDSAEQPAEERSNLGAATMPPIRTTVR